MRSRPAPPPSPAAVAALGHSQALLARRPPPPRPLASLSLSPPLPPPAQPASLLPLRLSQPGLRRAAPCGIRALPRRDPSLTSPCWDAATFPAKLCLPWLYYVCVRRSPASRGRQRRRRETGSQSQDKEKAGRQRLAGAALAPHPRPISPQKHSVTDGRERRGGRLGVAMRGQSAASAPLELRVPV